MSAFYARLLQSCKLALEGGECFRRSLIKVRAFRHTKHRLPFVCHGAPITTHERSGERHAFDILSEEPDVIERRGAIDQASRVDAAIGRFEADHAAEGGRADDRADRLGAERKRAIAGRDGSSRATARSAGGVLGITRVARWAG